ncbi:MAG: two component transcriptional regulator, winged helix family protein [bacterium]|nr:two component transcriptional regulator, winged helix family protein [bacterium]
MFVIWNRRDRFLVEPWSVRILVVEDDLRLGRFLERVLVEEGYSADRCGSGADAITQLRALAYDLVLLDWMIPDLDGLEVCRQIRRGGSTVPILMLTARDQVPERVLGLDAGADDYLIKPFEVEELLARINALLRRSSGHAQLDLGALQLDRAGRRALVDGKPLELTSREFALLLHLAHRADRIVTRSELLSQVWSIKFDPESNVVEVHISRLRDKLGELEWMIETVRGRGYRLRTRAPKG